MLCYPAYLHGTADSDRDRRLLYLGCRDGWDLVAVHPEEEISSNNSWRELSDHLDQPYNFHREKSQYTKAEHFAHHVLMKNAAIYGSLAADCLLRSRKRKHGYSCVRRVGKILQVRPAKVVKRSGLIHA